MRLFVILFCLWFTLTSCQTQPLIKGEEAKLKRVISTQSLELIINNKTYRLRLTGLDNNSLPPPIMEEGKQYFTNLLSTPTSVNLIIETDLEKKDKFARISGYAWYDDLLLNQMILKEGYSLLNLDYTDGKYDRTLINAQEYARLMQKGIWNRESWGVGRLGD